MDTITPRIAAVRAAAASHGLSDYLVPSADEHLNEYLPQWGERRAYLSGFDGSAGDLIVGQDDAWLYADGRYHLQAESQLEGTTISLMKVGAPGATPLLKHIEERARQTKGYVLGFDPMVLPLATSEALRKSVQRAGGQVLEVSGNLVDIHWPTRPEPVVSRLMPVPPAWRGDSTESKLKAIREDLKAAGANATVAVKLDQIAWLFNWRSLDDIPYNPVFESFLAITEEAVHLFIRDRDARLPSPLPEPIPNLEVHPYESFAEWLPSLTGKVLIDPPAVTAGVVLALRSGHCSIVRGLSPLENRKAIKNTSEQDAMRRANLRASVAKTRALMWLRDSLEAGKTVTESGFRMHLEALYSEQDDFQGLSFNTIAATGPHGAIIHYGQCDETPLEAGQLFLIDSGAHIGGGTTDDTRTVAVRTVDEESRRIYTLVLKGHINAARQLIPAGSAGSGLDALARAPLWDAGLNYDHGTGHGVGSWLCVHEGPFAISERERRAHSVLPLKAGHVSSIEPGYYRPGWGGVRIENLYLYVEATVEGGDQSRNWLKLEPLTWVPFDTRLIERDLLNTKELEWLDRYHEDCLENLAPYLGPEDLAQLRHEIEVSQ